MHIYSWEQTSHATYRLKRRSVIVQSVQDTVQALLTLR
jgi:hypothetical protein